MIFAPFGRVADRGTRRDGLPIGIAQAVSVVVAVMAIDQRAVAFASDRAPPGCVGPGDDSSEISPAQAVIGGPGQRHGLIGLPLVVITLPLLMHEAENVAFHPHRRRQPASAIIDASSGPGLQHGTSRTTQVEEIGPVDGIGGAIGAEPAECPVGKLQRGKCGIDFVRKGAANHGRRTNPHTQAIHANRALCAARTACHGHSNDGHDKDAGGAERKTCHHPD